MLTLLHDVYENVTESQLEYTNKFQNFTKYTEKCFNELRELVKTKEEEMQTLVDKYEHKTEKNKEHSKQVLIDYQMKVRDALREHLDDESVLKELGLTDLPDSEEVDTNSQKGKRG